MRISSIIRKMVRAELPQNQQSVTPGSAYRKRSEQDIYFTARFHAKAGERGLTEEHARFVYYEGDTVRPNTKAAHYKGQELWIYYFHDRATNQPVITSIWRWGAR